MGNRIPFFIALMGIEVKKHHITGSFSMYGLKLVSLLVKNLCLDVMETLVV